MKKAIILILVVLVIGIPLYSNSVESSMDMENNNKASRYLGEGWNLVYGFIQPSQIIAGEINQENIKAIYGFIPQTQKYVRLYPNRESEKLVGIDDDEFVNTAFLIYSNKYGRMNYEFSVDSFIPYQNRQLYAGWNFVGITTDMNEILDLESAGCNIVKAAGFGDGNYKEWKIIDENILASSGMSWNRISFIDDPDDAANGILIKVTNNCKLGLNIPTPPSIPNN